MLSPWLERSRAFGLIFNALVASASPSRAALSPPCNWSSGHDWRPYRRSEDRLQGSLKPG